MFVNVEIKGPRGEPTKSDMQKNIDAMNYIIEAIDLNRVRTVKKPLNLSTLLIDTRSILKGIQRGLPS